MVELERMLDGLNMSVEIPDDLFNIEVQENKQVQVEQQEEDDDSEEVFVTNNSRLPAQRKLIKRKKVAMLLKRFEEDYKKPWPCERYRELYPEHKLSDRLPLLNVKKSLKKANNYDTKFN